MNNHSIAVYFWMMRLPKTALSTPEIAGGWEIMGTEWSQVGFLNSPKV